MSDSAARRRVSWPVAAWVAILILTGGFQIYRGAPVDGAVFLAMAGALILDLAGILPEPRTTEWRPSRIIPIGVLGAAAVVLALTPRHGIGDGIAIAVSGILVFLAATRRTGRQPRSRQRLDPEDASSCNALGLRRHRRLSVGTDHVFPRRLRRSLRVPGPV